MLNCTMACRARVHASTFVPRRAISTASFELRGRGAGLIDGAWTPASSGKRMRIINPSTALPFYEVADMGRTEALAAVDAARRALPAWAATTAQERGTILAKMFKAMTEQTKPLAALLTQESGKPFEEAQGEITYAASFLDWFSQEGRRDTGHVIPTIRKDRRMLTFRSPVGVCALLTPWNFSSAMVTRKLAPALAAGCTVVLRPSFNTPLSALAIAQIAEDAGLPKGVVNVVVGQDHAQLADPLADHPSVAKLSFTGSTRVGQMLATRAAGTLKRVSLELGGNAPFIVFQDAQLDEAVEGCIQSKFRNAGQTCVCANRVYVHADVYDTFVEKLTKRVAALRVGDGMTPGVQIGPLISSNALAKTTSIVEDAIKRGAKATTGGAPAPEAGKGFFYKPTVLVNADNSMRCVKEEIFGPVAPVVKFTSEADVIAQANESSVGLAAYFYTSDLSRAWRVSEALEVGMVGVNAGIISTVAAPFGGVKMSGYGREGAIYGMDEYTQVKYVMMGV